MCRFFLIRICTNFRPTRTFRIRDGSLSASPDVLPNSAVAAHRVLLRVPAGQANKFSWFGPWNLDSAFIEQYCWRDESTLLQTSTAQLRTMQAARRFNRHGALTKWEIQLNMCIPDHIWVSTWMSGRSACKNSFLWQLVYRVIATQRWHFPTRLDSDVSTWCTRCAGSEQEDIVHCIWGFGILRQCWTWAEFLLGLAARPGSHNVNLNSAHVFIAAPLLKEWHAPGKLWNLLRAVVCWQVWKDRNLHFFEGKRSDPIKIIHASWHRIGIYIRMEWRTLVKKIKSGKINYGEAELAMQAQFGSNPAVWNIHELTLEVPPVPPRPP